MWICENRFLLREIDIPLVQVDIGLLDDQVGVPAADTLDLGKSVNDLLLSINVCAKRETMSAIVAS